MQELKISIAVIIRNEARNIRRLLDSVNAINAPIIEEVLVIDNASEDESVRVVEEWMGEHPFLKTRIFFRSTNHMAEARNLALDRAVGSWIYFTDADCRLEVPQWERAIRFLKENHHRENLAAFGGGNSPPITDSFVGHGLAALRCNWWGHMGSIQVRPPSCIRQVSLLSTCNLFLNKRWANSCDGFDLAFCRAGEDLSLCHRLELKGGELWALPDIDVIHYQDKGFLRWCKKMFAYGEAQVYVAARYPRHFSGLRGLQFLFIIGHIIILIWTPQTLLLSIFIAVGLLVLGFKNSTLSLPLKLKGVFFILMTQASYATGELSASLVLAWRMLFSFPKKMPSLENR